MTPKVTPEQVNAFVARLNAAPVGKPERELRADPHGSRERFRSLVIAIARRRNPAIDATLLELWPFDKPLTVIVQDEDGKPKGRETSPLLNDALKAWAQGWNLCEPWFIERARKVLQRRDDLIVEAHFAKGWERIEAVLYWLDEAWKFDLAVKVIEPHMAANLIAATDTSQRAPAVATQRTFNPPVPDAWHPNVQSEKQYRDYIDDYIKYIREQIEKRGWIKPLEKHNPLHFEWLVRFQVEGEGYSAIAKSPPAHYEYEPSRQSVHKAVRALADDICLTLRS